MKLLLDVGNSRVKWALADGGALQSPEAAEHHGRPAGVVAAREWPGVREVRVSSVMGAEHDAELATALAAVCDAAPLFARTQDDRAGLRVAYAEPARLGVDRWLAMLGLWTAAREPFCVVNAGTALTFDAVDDAGQHLGGLIAPGLATAQNAVLGATRFPVRPGAARYAAGLGNDTESCVRQGALQACLGLIERAARNAAGRRYISGGDAAVLLPLLGGGWEWKPHAVLEGLLAWAEPDHV